MQEPSSTQQAGRYSLAGDPHYLRLWLAGVLDNTVRWLDMLAVGIFTFQTTGSAFSVSLLLFIRIVPMFVLGIFLGSIVERAGPRRFMAACNALLAAGYAILMISSWLGLLAIWQIAAVSLLSGVSWALDMPARRTMIMERIGVERIARAMAVETSTFNLTRALGPAIGGIVMQNLGMTAVYVLTSTMALLSALSIATVNAGDRHDVAARPSMVKEISEGLHYVRGQNLVLFVLFVTLVVNVCGSSYVSMIPAIGEMSFAATPLFVGLLMSAEGAGAFLCASILAFVGRPRHFQNIFFLGALLYVLGIFVFSLSLHYWLAIAALVSAGMGLAGFGSMQSTLILAYTPPAFRNRVMGILSVCIGSLPLGVLGVGLLAYLYGPTMAVLATGATGVALLLFAAIVRARHWRVGRPTS